MAISEIYVDPSIAADSGTGTIGDPFGDLEYAIVQTTFDTTNGTRLNIKAGTDEVLAANLKTAFDDTSVSVAWTTNRLAYIVIQGYTTAAGDGGVGGIDANLNQLFYDLTQDYVSLIDLTLHGSGVSASLGLDNWCNVIRCTIHDVGAGLNVGDDCQVIGCRFYNIGGLTINTEDRCLVAFNVIDTVTGTRTASYAIDLTQQGSMAYRNIIKVDGATNGIIMPLNTRAIGNSIYSVGGTGTGIKTSTTTRDINAVMNNVVEGFSGAGGIGFDFSAAGTSIGIYTGNSAYDNETNYSGTPLTLFDDYGANETLGASAFTDPTNMDFSPVDTGLVKEGATPNAFMSV